MENKKGNKKKKRTQNRQIDLDKKNQLNAEIEIQIKDEIKKVLKGNSILDSMSNVKEMKASNMSKVEDITINRYLIFSFVIL